MRDEERVDEEGWREDEDEGADRAGEEADAAAAEAGRIGGRGSGEGGDEAERPVVEQGGGEAEGFEEAEELLKERAEGGGRAGNPLRDAPTPEAERDPATYGEADDAEPADQADRRR